VRTKTGHACYTFDDGSVELRLEPEGDTADVGDYSGDKISGKIDWAAGGPGEYSSERGARYAVTRMGTTSHGSRVTGC